MDPEKFFREYASDCTAGSANQSLVKNGEVRTVTGRTRYRLEHGGSRYSLLFSNRVDSTFSDGSVSRVNDAGGAWRIDRLRVGLANGASADAREWHEVTFDGEAARDVKPGEGEFCTDPIPLNAGAGEYLVYEITVTGDGYPYHPEIVLPLETLDPQTGAWRADKCFPVPLMIGSDRPVAMRVGFLGDSITQGCGTAVGSYTHWVAKIAEGLGDEVSVWDLGIGYARANDAAMDGGWLARAKRCDVVHVCFGINDLYKGCRTAEQAICDLRTVVRLLRAAGCRVILLTVPPFNMTGPHRDAWYAINAAIRTDLVREATAVFDIAAILGNPEPDRHDTRWGGHPDAEGCALVAREYLAGHAFHCRKPRVWIPGFAAPSLGNRYVRALVAAGCEVIPDDGSVADDAYDGLFLSGGGDVDPARYGQQPDGAVMSGVRPERDAIEFGALERAVAAGKPVLGVCRGCQVINVGFGGTLVQDLATAADHVSRADGTDAHHEVTAEPGSRVAALYGLRFRVNSRHHQAADRPGEGLRVTARADDGTSEALEHATLPVWGIQWHPERLFHEFGSRAATDGAEIFRFFRDELEKRM